MLDHTEWERSLFLSTMMKGKLVKRRVPLVPDPRSVAGSRSHEATPAFPWNLSAHAHLTVLLLEGQMMPTASGQPVQWAFIAPTNFDAVGSPIGSRNKRK